MTKNENENELYMNMGYLSLRLHTILNTVSPTHDRAEARAWIKIPDFGSDAAHRQVYGYVDAILDCISCLKAYVAARETEAGLSYDALFNGLADAMSALSEFRDYFASEDPAALRAIREAADEINPAVQAYEAGWEDASIQRASRQHEFPGYESDYREGVRGYDVDRTPDCHHECNACGSPMCDANARP